MPREAIRRGRLSMCDEEVDGSSGVGMEILVLERFEAQVLVMF